MARSSDDSESEDDLVVLGTPLPELDETEVSKKPTTIQVLTAKDKEGRRRFHGAFTGGFSAGYFNTVGSKEGFTPSAFVSSRSQKHEDAEGSRPEDFMDEEDLDEHGIAPRKFATAKNFTSEERKRKFEDVTKSFTHSSTLDLGSALSDMVIPEYLPIGIKLLRKMGWREGQGLGPRVRKKKKKNSNKKKGGKKKIYGCALPPSDSDSEDSDSFIPANLSDLTFAPTDVTPISLTAKDDVKGLGYKGLDPTLALPSSHVNLFSKPVRGGKKTGRGIKGHAFGVGALEDEDEDIFGQDFLSNYDLTMKDDDDGQDSHFGWTAPRTHGKQCVPVSYVGKLLEGFCLSSKPLQTKKKFPPPSLPPNFKPYHWSRRRKTTDGADSGSKQNQMTAVDRGLMLGEKPIMSSVFDLVGAEGKSRINLTKEAIEMTKSLQTSNTSSSALPIVDKKEENTPSSLLKTENQHPKFLSRFTPASNDTNDDKSLSSTSQNTSTTKPLFRSSLSLQPFQKDPPKQTRFDQYLAAVQQRVPDPYGEVSNNRMTEWEKARERDEFSRSAKLFRPMSAMMSSRFVHGAMLDDKNEESKKEDKEVVSDEVKAAEMRMFGKLTRQEYEWHPDKLLCKRFNVPNPYPGSDIVGLPNVKRDKFSVFNFLSFGDYQPKDPVVADTVSTDKDPQSKESSAIPVKVKPSLSSIFKVLDDPDFHKSPQTTTKPEALKQTEQSDGEQEEEAEVDVDLFRAIFKNSDSEDSEVENSPKVSIESSSGEESNKNNNEKIISPVDTDKNSSVIKTVNPGGHNDPQNVNENQHNLKEVNEGRFVDLMKSCDDDGDNATTPQKQAVNTNKPFASVFQDPGVKSMRTGTRWGTPNTKSVFSVIDELDDPVSDAHKATGNKEDVSDEYGPSLPPSLEAPPKSSLMVDRGSLSCAEDVNEYKKKDGGHQHLLRAKRKHKKEKKKKSKHKSKDKKHKKSKKSSKSIKGKKESSGSEADSETSNEDSDKELLDRFFHMSRMKSGKS